jgi:hypothetical protein
MARASCPLNKTNPRSSPCTTNRQTLLFLQVLRCRNFATTKSDGKIRYSYVWLDWACTFLTSRGATGPPGAHIGTPPQPGSSPSQRASCICTALQGAARGQDFTSRKLLRAMAREAEDEALRPSRARRACEAPSGIRGGSAQRYNGWESACMLPKPHYLRHACCFLGSSLSIFMGMKIAEPALYTQGP